MIIPTPESLRLTALAIEAHARGETVQFRRFRFTETWGELGSAGEMSNFDDFEYRPKPVPVMRCWQKAEDVPLNCCIRDIDSSGGSWSMVVSAGTGGINVITDGGLKFLSYESLRDYRHSVDRQTWGKCEVPVE